MTKVPHTLFALVLILLLASATRILHISADSFWIDEGFTWYLTQMDDPFILLFEDVHPPLYFLMVRLWAMVTGVSELAFRYFSVLPSLVSIALIYQLGRTIEHHHGRRTIAPVLVALMLALADAENYLAQETRSYTWQVLWILLSMLGFLRWQWGMKHARIWWLVWLMSTVALIYTFYLAAFIGVVQGLYSLIFLRGRQRIMAIATLMIAALTLIPWLALTLGQQADNLSYAEWIKPNDFVLDDLRRRWFTRQWALMIGLALVGLVVLRRPIDGWRRYALSFLVACWFVVPLVLTFIANEFAPLYTPRRVTMITPSVALAVGFGLVMWRLPLRAFLVVVVIVYGVVEVDFWQFKQPWRDLVLDVAPYVAPSDLILVELAGDDYAPVYHFGRILPGVEVRGLTTMRRLASATYEADLPALLDAHDSVWLFYWGQDESAMRWLEHLGHERIASYVPVFNPDVRIYRYERDGDASPTLLQEGDVLRRIDVYE